MAEAERNQDFEAHLAVAPNAVVDHDKAWDMAHASKTQEGRVVEQGDMAMKALIRAGRTPEQVFKEDENASSLAQARELIRSDESIARNGFDNAIEARKLADEQAEAAGAMHDSVKTLKNGQKLGDSAQS